MPRARPPHRTLQALALIASIVGSGAAPAYGASATQSASAVARVQTEDGASGDRIVRRLGLPSRETQSAVATAGDNTAAKAPPSDVAALQERAIWALVDADDWSAARDAQTALHQAFPNRAPNRRLAMVIAEGLSAERLKDAVAAQDWSLILALTSQPDISPRSQTAVWAKTEALHALGAHEQLADHVAQAFNAAPSADQKRALLQDAIWRLNETGLTRLRHALPSLSENLPDAAERLETAELQARFDRLAGQGAIQEAASVAAALGDKDRLIDLASRALSEDQPALAYELFATLKAQPPPARAVEVRYGAALSAFQSGDEAPALALALSGDAPNEGPFADPMRALAGDALLKAAERAREAGRYDDTLAFAERAAAAPSVQRRAELLSAWTHLDRNDDVAAEANFRAVYQRDRDEEAASGLVLAAAKGGRLHALGPLARDISGPLSRVLNRHVSHDARGRRDYATALDLSPEAHADLQGVDGLWLRQSVSYRSTSGRAGEGRVRGVVTRTSVGTTVNTTKVEIGIGALALSSGAPLTMDPLAPAPLTEASTDLDAASPFIAVETQGKIRVAGHVSTTPIGGAVSAAPVGEANISLRDAGLHAEAGVFVRAKDDSVLSLAGRERAETGETWGRVVETGVEARVRRTYDNGVTVTAGVEAASLSGEAVIDNSRVKLEAGGAKAINPPGFDYVSTGPFVQYEAYEDNSNFYTPGHGGYFSPQSFSRVGWALNLQTEDARPWMARLDASAALERTRTDDAAQTPLTDPQGALFTGDEATNVAGAVEFEAARKLHARWLLSFKAAAIASQAFDDVRVGLALRYTPGGRAAVLTSDLGPDAFNRDIL